MLDTLIHLSWRAYPAGALMTLGTVLIFLGVRTCARILPDLGSGPRLIEAMSGFRVAVAGVTLAGLGASWIWHIKWLFVLALVFGGEEILESSTYLLVLRRPPERWRRLWAGPRA